MTIESELDKAMLVALDNSEVIGSEAAELF